MGNIKHKSTFRCSDDCRMEGCPSHELKISIQTCSDIMDVEIDGKRWFNSEVGQWRALIKALKEIDYIFFDTNQH